MKILITGTRGLAQALNEVYSDHTVVAVSKSLGNDIHCVSDWGSQFLDFDMLFNCAYDDFGQVKLLEYFYSHWKDNINKTIVNIGSKIVTSSRLDVDQDQHYWSYRLHKQALQQAHDTMSRTAQCVMKIFNPGAIDTDMISHIQCNKIDPVILAQQIRKWCEDPYIKRVDLWP